MPMPSPDRTTRKRAGASEFVLGVDGCRAGWIVARLNLSGMSANGFIAMSFAEILNGAGAQAAMIMVDMPIGLADSGRRACEGLARRRLKPGRTSSVFTPPRRPMLNFDAYEEANAWGKRQEAKGGLSKQAWMIAPKIREVDAAITPADQARLGEAHPEVAFARLNDGRPCAHAKRRQEGEEERLALLTRAGFSDAEDIYQALRKEHGAKAVKRDDVYDACALALTAKARLEGKAVHLSDGARDARGLVMEIWG
ncbi:DUF429 domain-containing protein [Hyphococcus luteus]|nr:DUF429 domain-containing protein [Marinicaulis flavus]